MPKRPNWKLVHNLQEEHTDNLARLLQSIQYLESKVTIHNMALARFIAKLDPNFTRDELDPNRRAESDAIAVRILDKLRAEYLTSNPVRK